MLLLANTRFQVAASNWLNMNQKESLLATYIFKYYVYISLPELLLISHFHWCSPEMSVLWVGGGENFPRYFLNSCSSDLLSWRSGIRMIWFGATHQRSNSVAAGKHFMDFVSFVPWKTPVLNSSRSFHELLTSRTCHFSLYYCSKILIIAVLLLICLVS